jgi:hypothetical protein
LLLRVAVVVVIHLAHTEAEEAAALVVLELQQDSR